MEREPSRWRLIKRDRSRGRLEKRVESRARPEERVENRGASEKRQCRHRQRAAAGVAVLLVVAAVPALAFGPSGHRIAGELAEPLLCPRAATAVAELSGGESLGELGLWADRIRGDERWRHTAPWHYMNIGDDERLESYEHPPEGDVWWAVEHHAARLAGSALQSDRAEALRFLVHFVVDMHQPLHVGRAEDRGGNRVDVLYNGTRVNLHRFWDTDAVRLAGSERRLIDALAPAARMLLVGSADDPPAVWAAESLALRSHVYAFTPQSRGAARLDDAYLASAETITRIRLAQAGARLAGVLNRLLGCDT